jgi:16S rRNA processing protein RimM
MIDRQVKVGRVSGLFGVQGWVKIYSFTQPIENVFRYRPWHLRKTDQSEKDANDYEVVNSRRQGKGLIAQFSGIDDRDKAVDLIGAEIFVERRQFSDIEPGEHYWTDLVGLPVETVDGRPLGLVDSLLATGANDVLVVEGEQRHLVPFIAGQVVKDVDMDAGKIVVEWDPDF